MIRENLSGKRIAITGSTGFLGTALVERFLRSVPDCELVLLVRPGRRGAEHRVKRDILKNDAFDRLRDAFKEDPVAAGGLGGETFDEMCDRRVFAVKGDVGQDGLGLDDAGLTLFSTVDIAVHSAATVSFDSALDDAVQVNLLGPGRVAAALRVAAEARTEPTPGGLAPGEKAYLVAVSTCYVAGSRRGNAPEQMVQDSPFFVDVDWRAEAHNAFQARKDAEQASRTPQRLKALEADAIKTLGAAGTPAIAERVESLRQKWVGEQMTQTGRVRAASLGFPDAYAFTKALGERSLVETRDGVPVAIVRPSIIESALAEPVPGWIRGFRMAEPVIAAYARGLLKEFPGVPEGVIDVIPVDLVVASILATAARGPHISEQSGEHEPDIIQIASGSANPFKYGQMVDLVQAYFTKNPVYDEKNQPISVPDWTFPGRGRVTRQLNRAKFALTTGERILDALPLRGKQAEIGADLEQQKEQLDRAGGYVELYGAYTECEATYQLDRMYALWNSLDEADQRDFNMDPLSIDWPHYAHDIQLPSTVKMARLKMQPSKGPSVDRNERIRKNVLSEDRHLAVFDLENTLIASNVVASYSWLATRHLDTPDRVRFVAKTLREAPTLWNLDRADRSDFLRYFYRRFEDAPIERLERDSLEMMSDLLMTKSFPAGIRRVRAHRALGHKTLLITGALDVVVEPLRPLFDHIVSAELGAHDGAYDGKLTNVPPTGEARYQALADYAKEHDLDLKESVAYADSTSDLPMLEAVGFPVAVNAETKLAAIARRRGWLIEHWTKSDGAPNRTIPIGPRTLRGPLRKQRVAAMQRRAAG
ncbi:MAG: HAD-IB family hydrolase [Actinomycetota bacterium]|nr:HAD-IB family hydrolase [Actinomycetota bacterium]